MSGDSIVFQLFMVFAGAAVLATGALFARQALVVVYIILGVLLGPSVFAMVPDTSFLSAIAEIGIIFLLFLLGLNLHPQKLFQLFGSALLTTLLSSSAFAVSGIIIVMLFGFSFIDGLVIGVSMMFSSTILGLKLLPTSVLHHQHTGGIIISVLLLQDIVAITCLLFIKAYELGETSLLQLLLFLVGLPALVLFAKFMQEQILTRLLLRFDTIQEYIFLLAIGWCLGMAELAEWLGLSAEMGAFIAGVAMATNPVSTFIAERLKPLRDFFLVLFFFAVGASVDMAMMPNVLLAAVILAGVMLLLKPIVFSRLLQYSGESETRSREIGIRLGQISEFSLLISVLALSAGLISQKAAYLIQAATLLTFLISPYLIVLKYPTPIGMSESLRRD